MRYFFRPLKKERLRPDEFQHMKLMLQDALKKNTISATPSTSHTGIFTFTHLLNPKPMFATIFLAMLIALGGGTAAAAEKAAPGDALYPFKIHINESVRGAIAVSTDAEADWQSTRAVRRLEEAAGLAAEGRLDIETREKLRTQFAAHQEKAERLLADLSAKGKTDAAASVSSHIEANLSAYSEVLTSLKKSRPTTTDMLADIRNEVKVETDQAVAARAQTEATIKEKTEQAAEGRKKAAENKIEEVQKYIEGKKIHVEAAAISQARAQLKLAEEKMTQGNASLAQEKYGEAFIEFQQAHMFAQRAKLTLKTIHKLNISLLGSGILDSDDDKENKHEEKQKDEKRENEKTVASTTLKAIPTPIKSSTSTQATSTIKTHIKTKLTPARIETRKQIDVKVSDSDERD